MATDKKVLKAGIEQIKCELYGNPLPNMPPALGLCDACARRTPIRTKTHRVLYCSHNRAGAFYVEFSGTWTTVSPIAMPEFCQAMGVASAVIVHDAQAEAETIPAEGKH